MKVFIDIIQKCTCLPAQSAKCPGSWFSHKLTKDLIFMRTAPQLYFHNLRCAF